MKNETLRRELRHPPHKQVLRLALASRLTVSGLIVACLVACGASAASKREMTIKATLTAVDAAAAGLVAFEGKHELDIVSTATSHDDGVAKLQEFRKKRDVVQAAIVAAYKAIAAAATLDNDQSLSGMLQAALLVQQGLEELGVKL